jgi:hypothetical protein
LELHIGGSHLLFSTFNQTSSFQLTVSPLAVLYWPPLDAAKTALEVQPGYINAIQAVTYIQITSGQTDEQTDKLLSAVIERAEEEEWKEWAKREQLKFRARQN